MSGAMKGVGTLLTAFGQYDEGKREKKRHYFNAAVLEQNAGQEQAYAQMRAIEQRRQARLVASRAKAVIATTGASDDPTAQRIKADIATEGEMRAMIALYEGDEAARGLKLQARAERRAGKDAYHAGKIGAVSTIFSGGSDLYDKYGPSTAAAGAG